MKKSRRIEAEISAITTGTATRRGRFEKTGRALQLTKQRTAEARRVVAINEARSTAAENDAISENY